eukprot:7549078-Ditylum_brightwellii.AAC.1
MYGPGNCTRLAGACMPALHVYIVYICVVGICDGTAGACDLASVLSFARFVCHPVLSPDSQFWAGSTHPYRTLGDNTRGKNCGRLGCGDRGGGL